MTVDTTGTRRNTNKVNALALAKIGVAIFPSSGKVPLVPAYHTLDASFTPEQRAAEVESYQEDHDGKEPRFVGCTTSVETVKAMWRAFPDAVPSIACGPSKLVVLDADTKNNGPELIGALFEENGGIPEGVFISTTRSGGQHFVFSDPDSAFTNTEGMLGKRFGCNVRGRRGQFVAPGSIRDDGKSYGTRADLAAFCRAVASKKLPTLPPYIIELIGASSSDREQVAPSKEREIVAHLQDTDWPEFEDIFDATLGKYDLGTLRAEDDAFARLYDAPSDDCSDNRFMAARALMRQWPDMQPEELAIFFEHWAEGAGAVTEEKPKAGEYDLRQIAREWIKNQGLSKPSSGEAFGAVNEPDEQEAYIANGGTKEGWENWQNKITDQRKAREQKKTADKTDSAKSGKTMRSAGIAPGHLSLRGIDAIPPRGFIYRRWLMRGAISVLIAPGGRGKSALTLSMAIDIACGVDRLGAKLARPRGVYLYNAEDSLEEMERRAESYMAYHDFTPEQRELVSRNLHLQSGVDGLLKFATVDRFNVVVNDKLIDDLVKYVQEHEIEVISLDPLATLHGIPENDNVMMTHVADAFRRVIKETEAAMLIAHHTRKVQRGSGQLDANDSRGATAIINSARIVLNINDIASRAGEFQIVDEPWRYFAVSTGDKVNLSPRDPSVVVFKINSVQANNASAEFEADNSPAISLHKFIRQNGLGEDDTETVLAALDGPEPVGSDSRHANWIGRLIAEAAGWDVEAKHVRASLKGIIEDWARRRWIVAAVSEADGKGANRRKPVGVYKRGDARPERRACKFDPVDDEE